MTFILTNDDGIDALGIQALYEAVGKKGVIIAPNQQYSGCGHQVTTRTPIKVEKRSDFAYAIAGTPADCVRLGVKKLTPEVKWVLSGINAGGNLGSDQYISGTVAAVREAALLGIPGIAVSHWIRNPWSINWENASRWTQKVLNILWERNLPPKSFWNVNLPHLEPDSSDPPIVFCQSSTDPLLVDYEIDGDYYRYQGEYSQRPRTPETDVDVCFSGKIAVTLIKL
ncbi:MAG: 5'/3'-nucleotidase SurE [Microcystaceae cyanobacterium]